MKKPQNRYIPILLRSCLFLALMPLFGACATEDDTPSAKGREITFRAAVSQADDVSTRAIVNEPVTFTQYGSEPFYIYANTRANNSLEEYGVRSGNLGLLSPVDEALLWFNPTDTHVFYGWTMPWQEDDFKIGGETKTKVSFLQSTYQELFPNDRNKYYNCRLLEKFIGAKTPALSYESNGEVVEMYYQHLVSKISINALTLIDDEGYTTEGVEATMTFYQLPHSAIFDRIPDDGSAPHIIPDPETEYGISCTVGAPTQLYIAPNQDFANMQFSIHIEGEAGNKDYYGDFKSVIFQRENTDQPEWDEGKSKTILYAGEEMTINLTVRDGNAGGNITVNISNWYDTAWRQGTGYPRNGIYSDSELLDLYNKFGQAYTEEAFEEMFDIYGEEVDGKKVFYLYEDGKISHTRLPVPKEAILDGAGHTVQINNTSHNIGDKENAPYVAHIGQCRNIFITNGTHIIYIDEDGFVYLVDPDTLEMEKTENQLPPLEGTRYNSYYIDYETGNYQLTTSY